MKPSELKETIVTRFKADIERSLLVEGPPGIGKTTIPQQAAKELGVACRVLHAPLMQPEDYGFPVISAERDNVKFIVSRDKFPIEGSDCPDQGILVIDEIPQCDNSGQKILANLIEAREIHGVKLKPGWKIVATGNRTTDRAGANKLLSHLRDRVTAVTLEVSLDDWTHWALANGVKPEVVAFIRFRPELLNGFDPHRDDNPTPRSWVKGVSATLGITPKELEFEIFKGDVGEGAAAEFLGFLQIFRTLPNPDVILLNPATYPVPDIKTEPGASATLYALCGALAHRTTPDNFGRVFQYIERMPSEFITVYVRDALNRRKDIQHSPDFTRAWADKIGKLLT